MRTRPALAGKRLAGSTILPAFVEEKWLLGPMLKEELSLTAAIAA
jgi:hypothetical protein